jgi:hypothetical protein
VLTKEIPRLQQYALKLLDLNTTLCEESKTKWCWFRKAMMDHNNLRDELDRLAFSSEEEYFREKILHDALDSVDLPISNHPEIKKATHRSISESSEVRF